MKTIYISSIILIIIIFFLHTKKKEHLLTSNEAVNNIASLYSNTTATVAFNNINSTGSTKLTTLDVSGTANLKDINVSGNINKKQNKARYIRIGNRLPSAMDKADYWTIKEIEVYDQSGINIALYKPVTVTAGTTPYPGDSNWGLKENIVNGRAIAANDNDTDCYHGNTGENELEIDLGVEYDISQIVLHNRYSADYSWRANNTSIQLLDANRNKNRVIYTGNWLKVYSKEYIL
jgi:hypothetical protein